MKKFSFLSMLSLCFVLVSCTTNSVNRPENLKKLNQDELKSLIIGNTLTYQAVWGRWAEYHREDFHGFGGAWSTLFDWFGWRGEKATSSYKITDDAQICWYYSGESVWANPQYEYCAIIHTANNAYYLTNTKNPRDPSLEGVIRKLEIKNGDYYELFELNNTNDG